MRLRCALFELRPSTAECRAALRARSAPIAQRRLAAGTTAGRPSTSPLDDGPLFSEGELHCQGVNMLDSMPEGRNHMWLSSVGVSGLSELSRAALTTKLPAAAHIVAGIAALAEELRAPRHNLGLAFGLGMAGRARRAQRGVEHADGSERGAALAAALRALTSDDLCGGADTAVGQLSFAETTVVIRSLAALHRRYWNARGVLSSRAAARLAWRWADLCEDASGEDDGAGSDALPPYLEYDPVDRRWLAGLKISNDLCTLRCSDPEALTAVLHAGAMHRPFAAATDAELLTASGHLRDCQAGHALQELFAVVIARNLYLPSEQTCRYLLADAAIAGVDNCPEALPFADEVADNLRLRGESAIAEEAVSPRESLGYIVSLLRLSRSKHKAACGRRIMVPTDTRLVLLRGVCQAPAIEGPTGEMSVAVAAAIVMRVAEFLANLRLLAVPDDDGGAGTGGEIAGHKGGRPPTPSEVGAAVDHHLGPADSSARVSAWFPFPLVLRAAARLEEDASRIPPQQAQVAVSSLQAMGLTGEALALSNVSRAHAARRKAAEDRGRRSPAAAAEGRTPPLFDPGPPGARGKGPDLLRQSSEWGSASAVPYWRRGGPQTPVLRPRRGTRRPIY
eukprot:TRINITY_DN34834_c0_g1_i1.p1 TRINITY_DN34834_c0_g1~~TRINITY_DN34834_c0_g1_i1.p1  ORF type:complete len:644 (+),score=147.54 TRINITY_DN34834_c0_g1_i1:68-1933(+)